MMPRDHRHLWIVLAHGALFLVLQGLAEAGGALGLTVGLPALLLLFPVIHLRPLAALPHAFGWMWLTHATHPGSLLWAAVATGAAVLVGWAWRPRLRPDLPLGYVLLALSANGLLWAGTALPHLAALWDHPPFWARLTQDFVVSQALVALLARPWLGAVDLLLQMRGIDLGAEPGW